MMSTNEQRAEKFLRELQRQDIPGPAYRMETRFTVSAEWMRASLENARRDLPADEVVVKGFRLGKAPPPLLERIREERARALASSWVTNDLRAMIEQDPEILLLASPAVPAGIGWGGIPHPFEVVFTYRAWRYPRLEAEVLMRHLKAPAEAASLEERVFTCLSERFIPAGIEEVILAETEVGAVLGDEGALTRRHLRKAIANNLLARTLGVKVDEADLEQAYGALAIEHSRSLIEIREEIEPNREVFLQKVEADKALGILAEKLAAPAK